MTCCDGLKAVDEIVKKGEASDRQIKHETYDKQAPHKVSGSERISASVRHCPAQGCEEVDV